MQSPHYQGIYINLERCLDRRIFIEHHLRQVGMLPNYKRFDAISSPQVTSHILTEAEIGCLESNMQIVRDHAHGDKHLHIIDDDIFLDSRHHIAIEHIAQNYPDQWDILYTGAQVALSSTQLDSLGKSYNDHLSGDPEMTLLDMSRFSFCGTFSYIVNKKSIKKLLEIYDHQDYTMPIDLLLRTHICSTKTLKGLCLFPFLALHHGHFETTMQERPFELSYKFQQIFQKPFQLGAKLDKISKELCQYATEIGYEIHHQDNMSFQAIMQNFMALGNYIQSRA